MRTFIFDIDKPHLRAVNETHTQLRQLQISAVICAGLAIVGGIVLTLHGTPWSIILLALVIPMIAGFLYAIVWAHKQIGSLAQLYQQSPLIPAIVSEVRPRGVTLLALVDLRKQQSPNTSSHFALATRSVHHIPGHLCSVGTKVPSVAIFANQAAKNNSDSWEIASPMPLCWGTRSTVTLASAQSQIPDSEWKFLSANISLASTVAKKKQRMMTLEELQISSDAVES